MITHQQIWQAIDRIAAEHGLSPSGLARRAGLDPTAFNKSKRLTAKDKPRWPSTESLAKILEATNENFDTLADYIQNQAGNYMRHVQNIPVIGFAEAGTQGFFDDGGFPAGSGWDEVTFPNTQDENAYALEVSGDSMQPLYRDGDTIIVSPNASVRKGDRVVVKTKEGEVMAKVLKRRSTSRIILESLNPSYDDREIAMKDVAWIARILWASQ